MGFEAQWNDSRILDYTRQKHTASPVNSENSIRIIGKEIIQVK